MGELNAQPVVHRDHRWNVDGPALADRVGGVCDLSEYLVARDVLK